MEPQTPETFSAPAAPATVETQRRPPKRDGIAPRPAPSPTRPLPRQEKAQRHGELPVAPPKPEEEGRCANCNRKTDTKPVKYRSDPLHEHQWCADCRESNGLRPCR